MRPRNEDEDEDEDEGEDEDEDEGEGEDEGEDEDEDEALTEIGVNKVSPPSVEAKYGSTMQNQCGI